MEDITFKVHSRVSHIEEIQHLIDHRLKAFSEQGFPAENEVDSNDFKATHLEIFYKGVSVGTSRLFEKDGQLFMGRVSIDKSYRSLGLGKILVRETMRVAGSHSNHTHVHLWVLHHLIAFYQKFGAKIVGEPLVEKGKHFTLLAIELRSSS